MKKRDQVSAVSHQVFRKRVSLFSFLIVVCTGSFLSSCNSPYVPKPTGYYDISFPEKKYRMFNEAGYPYSFEYPVYGDVTKDSVFFDSTTENPYWINISFPRFSGRIYISYKSVGKYKLSTLVNDAYSMTSKHTSQASGINDSLMTTPNGLHGVFFSVEGDVATADQFFITDSSKNFLRGALYFEATPNEDSLRPVNDFLMADMKHLINTLKWK